MPGEVAETPRDLAHRLTDAQRHRTGSAARSRSARGHGP
jgi:hypothetical protein